MHSFASFTALAALLSTGLAAPAGNPGNSMMYDPNGNIQLTFSMNTINIGVQSLEAILDDVGKACSTNGQCDGTPLTYKTSTYTDSTVEDLIIDAVPAGDYPIAMRNNLVDTLKAAVMHGASCTDGTYTDSCKYMPPSTGGFSFCPYTKTPFHMCSVPAYWGINFQDPKNNPSGAPPNMGVTVDSHMPANNLCLTYLGAAAGFASAVSGPTSGLFTLLSIFCQ